MPSLETRFLSGAVVVLGLCAVALTGLLLRRELFDGPSLPPAVIDRPLGEWRHLAQVGHGVGSAAPKHTMIIFTDYQCPSCKDLEATVGQALTSLPSLRVVYRHFPLRVIHPAAETAANAIECAAAQGAFSVLHAVLFDAQTALGQVDWPVLARNAGVPDIEGFATCLTEKRYASRVVDDLRTADSLGLASTPSVIIDGLLLGTPPTIARLIQLGGR